MRRWLKQVFCRHDWYFYGDNIVGVTLGWDARPTPLRLFKYGCRKCLKMRAERRILPRSIESKYTRFANDDWPLTEHGKRMAVGEGDL